MNSKVDDPLFVVQADMVIGIVSDPDVFKYLGTTDLPKAGELAPPDWTKLTQALAVRTSEVMSIVPDTVQVEAPKLHILGRPSRGASMKSPIGEHTASPGRGGLRSESVEPTESREFPNFGPPKDLTMEVEKGEDQNESKLKKNDNGLVDSPGYGVPSPGESRKPFDFHLNLERDDEETGENSDVGLYETLPLGSEIEVAVGVAAGRYADVDDRSLEYQPPIRKDEFGLTAATGIEIAGLVIGLLSLGLSSYGIYLALRGPEDTNDTAGENSDKTIIATRDGTIITVDAGVNPVEDFKIVPIVTPLEPGDFEQGEEKKSDQPEEKKPDQPEEKNSDQPLSVPGDEKEIDIEPGDPAQQEYERLQEKYRALFGQIGEFVKQEWFMGILKYMNQLPNSERQRFIEERVLTLTSIPKGISISRTIFADFVPLFCISAEDKREGIVATLWFDAAQKQGLDRLRRGRSLKIPSPFEAGRKPR